MTNIILNTDSYKCSHYLQYPPKTKHVSSYIEARGGDYDFTLFYGLQMYLNKLKAPTIRQVNKANEIITAHGEPFNYEGWMEIAKLGYLPLRIQAVKEGLVVPTKNVLVQVTNTDEKFPWLTSWMETSLLRAVWYPTTVATRSKFCKNIIYAALKQSADDPDIEIMFKLHDFGARGVSSEESANIGGSAHLINFLGTDTLSCLETVRENYGENMAGFSIPAAEHSTITSWGKNSEAEAYANNIKQFSKPGSIYAVVSDSYDIYNACSNIWPSLKDQIIAGGGTLVIRPDSGDPKVVVLEVLQRLDAAFDTSLNTKGYKVLPPYLRVIQGDGVNEHSIKDILDIIMENGYSASNLAFGMGGELLQTVNRDTQKWAMKASAIKHNGLWIGFSKDPATDPGKRSKMGRLGLIKTKERGFETVPEENAHLSMNLLEDVYRDGKILRTQRFSDIRALSNT